MLLSIASNSLSLPHNENIGKNKNMCFGLSMMDYHRPEYKNRCLGKALDVVQKHYSKDLHQVIVYLIFGPNTLNGTNGQLR